MNAADLSVGELNGLHMDFRDRLLREFSFLLNHYVFAEMCFEKGGPDFHRSLRGAATTFNRLFETSFEGLVLSVCRIWDPAPKEGFAKGRLSLPVLVKSYAEQDYLGFRCLRPGEEGRQLFSQIHNDSLLRRLRVFRTEALSHMLVVGCSRDREKADIANPNSFELRNDDLMGIVSSTLKLLKVMLDCQNISKSKWDKLETIEAKRIIARAEVEAFFSHLTRGDALGMGSK